jgi:hypothetical protein
MSMTKRVLNPARLRQVPAHFSWLDHRLVRERYLERAEVNAWALYLFLVCVADAQGLSYYGDVSLGRQLGLSPERLQQARRTLLALDLIAYEPPFYQVLSLPAPVAPGERLGRLRAALGGRS